MEAGIISVLFLISLGYLLLGVMTSDVFMEEAIREAPRKYRPIVRAVSVVLWPIALLLGAVSCLLTFIFKEWLD